MLSKKVFTHSKRDMFAVDDDEEIARERFV